MRNTLILLFPLLFISLTISGTTYYIDPSGNNNNNGSASSPWNTLSYACSKVTAPGDIIHVNAGTYLETNQCVLAAGVSIEGTGTASVIKSHYASTRGGGGISGAAINLTSATQGTNGNQHISNIKLDGDYQTGTSDGSIAYVGILVLRRSNVKIYNCTIVNFFTGGVAFHGSNPYNKPSVYATGNEIYNCILTDNGDTDNTWSGAGQIEIGSQDGILIHDNTIRGTGKAQGHNGNILSGVHYNKGVKYYNNKSYKNEDEGGQWNFHIEMWNTDGGFEVYNNEFWGGDTGIDIAGLWNNKGSYAYSWYVHDNLFTGTPVDLGNSKYCIDMENKSVLDVWIYRNHFLNRPSPINVTNGTTANSELRRIYICYNIMEKCGWNNSNSYINLMNFNIPGDMVVEDVFIHNNVILGDQVTYTTAIKLDNRGTITNFNIINNIIENNQNATWLNVVNNGTINGLHLNNNILYKNANNNDPILTGNSVSNYEFLNNQKVDPLFVSSTDFHLKTGSPAIGKGLAVQGSSTDYEGKAINNPPSIGAFESGSKAAIPAAIPVCQNSVVTNSSPSLLEMTYNMTLANSVPAASAFKVLVNSVATAITNVVISGAKVQLILASEIKFGDIVTVSYTKPSTNPLKSVNGGEATNISALNTINNVSETPKEIIPASIKMTIYPNPVHQVLNILFESASSLSLHEASLSSRIIRIFDMSGKLFIEKLLEPGISNYQIPINLKPGIYTILMLSGGMNITAQKMMVY